MIRRYINLLLVLTLLSLVLASVPAGEAAGPIEIKEATYAHGLTDNMEPVDPDPEAQFTPDETVYLSVTVKGRPKEGVVTARFFRKESLIAEGSVDVADVNSGLVFSFGQDTYVGFDLTHANPFLVSDNYYAEVYSGNEQLATYPFHVVPPANAIPSQISEAVLARGADENYAPIDPTDAFETDEKVYLVGHGDLGLATWLQVEWYLDGVFDDAGTRSITAKDNLPGAGFSFSYLPTGGWPTGTHGVMLIMNDEEVGRYQFTTKTPALFDKIAFLDSFPLPDDGEVVDTTSDYDGGFVTSMTEPELFDAYAGWLTGQGWKQQAPAEAMVTLPHQVWRTDGGELLLEIQGQDDQGRTIAWLKVTKILPPTTGGFTGGTVTHK